MWSCNRFPFSGGWYTNFFHYGILSTLIWALMVLLIVYVAIRIFTTQSSKAKASSQDRIDSLAILKIRFAKGEITREEFMRMKQMLSEL